VKIISALILLAAVVCIISLMCQRGRVVDRSYWTRLPRGGTSTSMPPFRFPRGKSAKSPPCGWDGSAVDSES
jgi:hypothetical protein